MPNPRRSTIQHAPAPRIRRFATRPCRAAAASVFGALLLAGCADPMARLDARTDQLVRDQAASLGGGATSPRREYEPASAFFSPKQASTELDTRNPEVGQLEFEPASEARDVSARLDAYARDLLGTADDADVLEIGLEDAFRISQRSAREFLAAEEDYLLAAIRLLVERRRWGPRLFHETATTLSGDGVDGRFEHAVNIVNSLAVTQRLPYGGEVEARWLWNATEQLRSSATGRYRQSSELIFGANLPLLRGAGTIAREDLIQAERDLIYQARTFERFRRSLLVGIAGDFFALLQSQARIENQLRQIEGLEADNERTRGLVDAGRLPAFNQQITANRLLSAEATLANLRENYILQLERFKIRLGLPVEQRIRIRPHELDIREPEISVQNAVEHALAYRLDLQNQRDRLDDSRRTVRNARNQTLPDLNLAGQVGIPTDPSAREGGFAVDPDQLDYAVGLSLRLPLDRDIERFGVRQAVIQLERARRGYEQFRDEVVVDARQAVRQIDLARFQLRLAEQQVVINQLGLADLMLRDDADPQRIIERRNDLLDAEDARDQARTDLRNAVLSYLLQTGQLRVDPDGVFIPLEGMDTPAEEDPPMNDILEGVEDVPLPEINGQNGQDGEDG